MPKKKDDGTIAGLLSFMNDMAETGEEWLTEDGSSVSVDLDDMVIRVTPESEDDDEPAVRVFKLVEVM